MWHLFYILDGQQLIPMEDVEIWGYWYENIEGRRIGQEWIGGIEVSTVCLGIAHGEDEEGRPMVFETMVFGGVYHEVCMRYSTYAAAEWGHICAVSWIQEAFAQQALTTGEAGNYGLQRIQRLDGSGALLGARSDQVLE